MTIDNPAKMCGFSLLERINIHSLSDQTDALEQVFLTEFCSIDIEMNGFSLRSIIKNNYGKLLNLPNNLSL